MTFCLKIPKIENGHSVAKFSQPKSNLKITRENNSLAASFPLDTRLQAK